MSDARQPPTSWPSILWRGFAMGAADIIPGISGGTIALITHIYERLIDAVRGLAQLPQQAWKWVRGEQRTPTIDAAFLTPLAAGIVLALALMSRVLPVLLEHYPKSMYALFTGLILAATAQLWRTTTQQTSAGAWAAVGAVAGFALTQLPITQTAATPALLLGLGAIVISAMLLPGISGSYLLLIAGQYTTLLAALQQPLAHWQLLAAFLLGAAIGAAVFSHAIHYALAHHEDATLAALTGVMFGALARPVQEIIESQSAEPLVAVLLSAAVGFALVTYLERRR